MITTRSSKGTSLSFAELDTNFIELDTRTSSWVDVSSYLPSGYVMDGSIDYTTQIKAAITATPINSEIRFPTGTFSLTSPATVPAGLKMRGFGTTLISSGNFIFILSGPADIQGFTFESTETGSSVDVAISGAADTLSGTTIRNNSFGRTKISMRDAILDETPLDSGLWIENNEFHGDYTGAVAGGTYDLIDVHGWIDVHITGNNFRVVNQERFLKITSSCRDVWVSENSFVATSGTNGKQAIDMFSDIRNAHITNNLFDITGTYTSAIEAKTGDGNVAYSEPSEIVVTGNIIKLNGTASVALFFPGSWGTAEQTLAENTITISNNIIQLVGATSTSAQIDVRGFTSAVITGNTITRDTTTTFAVSINAANNKTTLINENKIGYGFIQINGAGATPGSTSYTLSPLNVSIVGNVIESYKSLGAIYLTGISGAEDVSIVGNLIKDSGTGSSSDGVVKISDSTVARLSVIGNTAYQQFATYIWYDTSTVSTSYVNGNSWQFVSAAPTAGTWIVGDTIVNSSPTAGGPSGWTCVVAGSPGTWVPTGYVRFLSEGSVSASDNTNIAHALAAAPNIVSFTGSLVNTVPYVRSLNTANVVLGVYNRADGTANTTAQTIYYRFSR